jgi:pyrroline-5-carboxylate reductase
MHSDKIAIIGGGNMGISLLGGLIAAGFAPQNIYLSEPDATKREQISQRFGINVTCDNVTAAINASVIILAVKPQVMGAIVQAIAAVIQSPQQFIISIAAGITLKFLQNLFKPNTAIVRCMPNTPALVGEGATGLFANPYVTSAQLKLTTLILEAVGYTVWLKKESDLDIVTAISGSGPAYFFLIMEILQAVGEELGLDSATSRALTIQTALGAARMAKASPDDLASLRVNVTSPGGTTAAALNVLEAGNIRNLLRDALIAAKTRAEELAQATN